MAHAVEKIRPGREPVWIVEIDIDLCSLVHGVGACTATETGDDKCFNTRVTCNDTANYALATHTYRFVEPRSSIPATLEAFPFLKSVSIAPTTVTVGRGLGFRGSVSITMKDAPHHDRGVDPYIGDRTYDSMERSTFWRKFMVRNPYHVGRIMRVYSGYITDPFDLAANFVSRTYLVEDISGPDASGNVTITGKDPLKLADDDRAQAPVANTGTVDAGFTAGLPNSFNLLPAGVGNLEYSAAGTIRIGKECMSFTRVADAVTLTARGTDGTTDASHEADDAVQECLRYTSQTVATVANDLLVNYAYVDAAYITIADWDAQCDEWLSGHSCTTLITSPTGVKKLLGELSQLYMVDWWWDERDAQIRMRVVSPPEGALDVVTDDANFIAGSVTVAAQPDERVTQVWVSYGQQDVNEFTTNPSDFQYTYVVIDADAETANEFGDQRIKKYFSRWFVGTGNALRLAGRMLSRLRAVPKLISFQLDGKDTDYWTGSEFTMQSDKIVDANGQILDTNIFILETKEVGGGHGFAYKAMETQFKNRYARISPNGTPDYDAATTAQKMRYGWVAENAAPQLNGDGPYVIV